MYLVTFRSFQTDSSYRIEAENPSQAILFAKRRYVESGDDLGFGASEEEGWRAEKLTNQHHDTRP